MRIVESTTGVKIFISYAHADQEWRKKLEEHLSSLRYSGEIALWHDQEVSAGTNWEAQINTHFNEADIILFLISASFLASKYCWDKEVQAALERHKNGTAWVIPIVLKPVHWQNTPLGKLQALPAEGRPVTQWNDYDAAFNDIVQGIQKTVQDFGKRSLVNQVPGGDSLENDQESNFLQEEMRSMPQSMIRLRGMMTRREVFFLLLASVFAFTTVLLWLRPNSTNLLYQANWANGADYWAGSSDWHIQHGQLLNDGSDNSLDGRPTIVAPYKVEGTTDYEVEVQTTVLGGCGCFDFALVSGFMTDQGWTGYRGSITSDGQITIRRDSNTSVVLAHTSFNLTSIEHTYAIKVKGTSIEVFVDGRRLLHATDNQYLTGGEIGMKSYQTQLVVTSFKVIAV